MDIDAVYLAGFFDGEGCIRINKTLRRGKYTEYAPFITLGQKDGATLDWVKEEFGGSVCKVRHDGSYVWTATHRTARSVLERILPYLKYKRPQAELMLSFYQNTVQGGFISTEETARRDAITQQLKVEKRIFVPSLHIRAATTTKRIDPKGM